MRPRCCLESSFPPSKKDDFTMSYRVFITGSGIAEEAQQLLIKNDCTFQVGTPLDTPSVIAEKLKIFNPDALIVRQGKITEEVQNSADNLRVICKHGAGIDNIDVEAASRRGIPVMFTPLANYESVAEHTLALILSLIRKIPEQNNNIRMGKFDKKNFDGLELFRKTIGLIGFGHIGRRVAELIAPFKMKVVVYHPSFSDESLPHNISKVPSVEDVFPVADIISLHCPLTPRTKGMINEYAISQMKKDVYLINTARGGIINERDLILALQQKRIMGAALDVFEEEPPAVDNPLFSVGNVIVTSHIAGISDNSFKNMGVDAVNNILAVLKGESHDHECLVNKEAVEPK